jgi:dihydrolipoamide dehydrogenase
MAEIIIMPKLGFNMSVGKLVKWYKNEGDEVVKGEPVFAIETDKTNIDIEATADGVFRKRFIEEGDSLDVTLPIAIVADANENIGAVISECLGKLGKEAVKVPEEEKAPLKEAVTKTIDASKTFDYDVIVIGGGPGGYVTAIKSAQLGKKTLIIEKEHFGGVCLNEGCIPTKTLLRSSEALKEVKESAKFGVIDAVVKDAKLDMKKVQERKNQVIKKLVGGVEGLLRGNKVTIVNGTGSFVDKNTVEANGKKYTAENIIIASGSDVKMLPINVSKNAKILTSKEALNLDYIPEDIVIIGGGVIGIEFAYFLNSIGSKVTVMEFLDRILPMVDAEITDKVTKMLTKSGIKIYTSSKVSEIKDKSVLFEKDGKIVEVSSSEVLISVGRTAYTEGLNIETVGIKTVKGAIETNLKLETNIPNIYAIGDVNGKAMLAHTASMEGIIAIENICGHNKEMDYSKIPSAIYVQPEIASVGLTEEQARAQYKNVKVGKFPMMANGKAKVAGEEEGMIKVITEGNLGEILGVHMFCIHATDMIAEATVAMNLEATAEEIINSIHPHPTVSESIHEAFHAAVDKAIHFM